MRIKCLAQGHNCRAGIRTLDLRYGSPSSYPLGHNSSFFFTWQFLMSLKLCPRWILPRLSTNIHRKFLDSHCMRKWKLEFEMEFSTVFYVYLHTWNFLILKGAGKPNKFAIILYFSSLYCSSKLCASRSSHTNPVSSSVTMSNTTDGSCLATRYRTRSHTCLRPTRTRKSLECVYCPTLTKGSKWQITQIWDSNVFILDWACSITRPSIELKHSSCWKIFKSRHHDIALMAM